MATTQLLPIAMLPEMAVFNTDNTVVTPYTGKTPVSKMASKKVLAGFSLKSLTKPNDLKMLKVFGVALDNFFYAQNRGLFTRLNTGSTPVFWTNGVANTPNSAAYDASRQWRAFKG
ncbi:MAG: hypothetical protein P4N59_31445 [Negativicutes bacterium]|nr:hypothetical protein [Negativicutes bacterium]